MLKTDYYTHLDAQRYRCEVALLNETSPTSFCWAG